MSKGTGEIKKESGQKEEAHHAPKDGGAMPSRSKGHTPVAGGCFCWGCKKEAHKFNFCDEHYDHFKFGLIKKTGEPVSDYDKKLGHYLAHKAKSGSHKVA